MAWQAKEKLLSLLLFRVFVRDICVADFYAGGFFFTSCWSAFILEIFDLVCNASVPSNIMANAAKG